MSCGCYPHGPDEACTCPGCWDCKGSVVGCTCDINFSCTRYDPCREIAKEGRCL